jgi:hypothetical protein
MKNMKKLSMLVGAVLASTVALQQAQANSLSGDIEFFGLKYKTDKGTGTLGTFASPATKVTSVTSAHVVSGDGGYSALVGLGVTFNTPIIFTPPTPDSPLWTVVDGADTFIFAATTQGAVQFQYTYTGLAPLPTSPVSEIQFGGNGWGEEVLTANHADILAGPTPGTWTLQLQKNGTLVQFDAGSTTVPDGGLTVALLGGALAAMTLIRRRVAS